MSQGALNVANGPGATVRAAINAALLRLATGATGTGRPADIQTGEYWTETDNPGTGIWSVWRWDGTSDVLHALFDTATHAVSLISKTQSPGDSSTKVATTAFVAAALAGVSGIATIRYQRFTSTGTYTPHASMVKCYIRCIGGGAGGGGVNGVGNSIGAGGGGSGSPSWKLATAADIGASKAVTIGAGGAGGTAGNNNGSAGGDTSLGTLCIGKGGSPGEGAGSSDPGLGGLGGVAGTGDKTETGTPGGPGMFGVGGSVMAWSGFGGSSIVGGGGLAKVANTVNVAGSAGTGRGAGGSGAVSHNTVADSAGGAGLAGEVEIEEFCSA